MYSMVWVDPLTGKWVPANRALIVAAYCSHYNGHDMPFVAAYVPWEVCDALHWWEADERSRQCVTVLLKREVKSCMARMWRCSGPNSAASHPWQSWNQEPTMRRCIHGPPFAQRWTATGRSSAVMCRLVNACDVLHITPTLAGGTFHRLQCINHCWNAPT